MVGPKQERRLLLATSTAGVASWIAAVVTLPVDPPEVLASWRMWGAAFRCVARHLPGQRQCVDAREGTAGALEVVAGHGDLGVAHAIADQQE